MSVLTHPPVVAPSARPQYPSLERTVDALSSLTPSPVLPSVATGVLSVGPELARRILSECAYTRQRRLAEMRMHLYQTEMVKGLWRLSELRFARIPSGETFLVNGYTRLHALVASGVEIPFVITLVDVADMDEVASEYATLDSHRIRMTKDQLKGFDLESRLGLTLSEQEVVARTAGTLAAGFQSARHLRFTGTIQFRLPYVLQWVETARTLLQALHTGHQPDPPTKRITNVPIFSVALITTKFQPERASAFWRAVAANDGLRRGQPDYILRDFLARFATKAVSEWPGMARRTAACWNAYYEGRDISFTRAVQSHNGQWSPIRLAGTPYDGHTTIQLYGAGSLIPGTEPIGQRPEDIWARAAAGDTPNRPPTERELIQAQ